MFILWLAEFDNILIIGLESSISMYSMLFISCRDPMLASTLLKIYSTSRTIDDASTSTYGVAGKIPLY
jgi:hypothetical protein